VAARDYLKSLTGIKAQIAPDVEVDKMPFFQQSGLLGLALLEVLELKKAPLSGGGMQAMALTGQGVQPFTIRSSSVEYFHDRSADPDWRDHGPLTFTE